MLRAGVMLTWVLACAGAVSLTLLVQSQMALHRPAAVVAPTTPTLATTSLGITVSNTPRATPLPASSTPLLPSVTLAPSQTLAPPTATLTFPTRTRNAPAAPLLPRPTIIGYSAAGRPLEVFSFGNGTRQHLIVAGIHGGYEWNTIALADELIAYLHDHPQTIPEGTRLYILRAFNPDGEARSHGVEGRANENGVDLNRNFPALWQAAWPRTGCWDSGVISAGSYAASEPETLALMNFIQARPIDALMSYHSAALGIFPGGQPPDAASTNLAETLAAVSNYPYPPIDTGCLFTGQLIDWASQQGIAAVDIELNNHQDTDFDQNLRILAQFLTWRP